MNLKNQKITQEDNCDIITVEFYRYTLRKYPIAGIVDKVF